MTSHSMSFPALSNFISDEAAVFAEFTEIPTVTVRADEVPAGCEVKNRYANVMPLPETRVPLTAKPGDEAGAYINANFVRVNFNKAVPEKILLVIFCNYL